MISPKEIRKKCERLYKGYLLDSLKGIDSFPLSIKFRKVKATDDFGAIKSGVQQLLAGSKREKGYGYSVVLTKREMRRFGEQSLPTEIVIESEADYLKLIGKDKEVAGWRTAVVQSREALPQLEEWLLEKGDKILPYIAVWSDILLVASYFLENEVRHLYIRELPIPVHSKFIEQHSRILRHLLDFLLSETAVEAEETDFARRYQLKYDQPTIRVRSLDEKVVEALGWPSADLSFRLSDLAQLDLAPYTIYIIENKMNFLTFPALENSIAIWGSGFKATLLGEVVSLAEGRIFYWGDLDTHGLQILSQLRAIYPQTLSLLMDESCLMAHQEWIVRGPVWKGDVPAYLTEEETAVFVQLANKDLRLEQERITHAYLMQRLVG